MNLAESEQERLLHISKTLAPRYTLSGPRPPSSPTAAPPDRFESGGNLGKAGAWSILGGFFGAIPVFGCGPNAIGGAAAGWEMGGGVFGSTCRKAAYMSLGSALGVALNLAGTVAAPQTMGLSLIPSAVYGALAWGRAGMV